MKTRCLAVMGTRAEDQSLVSSIADKHGIKSCDTEQWTKDECIVPCFGWHPWFAHTMHISDDEEADTSDRPFTDQEKIAHYQKVLQPHRQDPSDEDQKIYLSLPPPLSLSAFLAQTRKYLHTHPLALVGEIGLDRSFRIPEAWSLEHASKRNPGLTPGGREGRRLTPFRCHAQHQKALFKKQLQLAAEFGRAVSIHGVQAHGMVYETLKELWQGHERPVLSKRERKKRGGDHPSVAGDLDAQAEKARGEEGPKPYPPRVCLHSYSGSPANFRLYLDPAIPIDVFASFSTAINLGDDLAEETPPGFAELVKAVPDERLLVESDLHRAGEEMDRRMEDIVRRICSIKGWGLEQGVRILGDNWRRFVFGTKSR